MRPINDRGAEPGISDVSLTLRGHLSMGTLVFFPWLRLEQSIAAGEFMLVPYERGSAPAGQGTPLQDVLDAVTEPYVERAGNSIHHATLVQVGEGDLARDLDERERHAVFRFSELLTVSGLSCRKFFGVAGLDYWNRDHFSVVVQKFTDPRSGVAVQTRRRDGSTTSHCVGESYRVQKPEHVHVPWRVCIDESLLQALLRAQDLEVWDSLWEALVQFDLANTDSAEITEQVETVLLTSALERLLGCDHGKEDALAERFVSTLAPTNDLVPGTCARLSGPEVTSRFKKSTTIRDMWIRDFFRLRGDLAHGRIAAPYPAVWSLSDHLLLASFVFPLLLKAVLAREGLYALNEEDPFWIDAFEPLAREEHFGPLDPEAPSDHPWNRVIGRQRQEQMGDQMRMLWLASKEELRMGAEEPPESTPN